MPQLMTVSVWAQCNASTWGSPLVETGQCTLAGVNNGTNNGFGLLFYTANGGAWTSVCYYSASLNIQQWHQYAATFDGTNVNLYLDGALVLTQAAPIPVLPGDSARLYAGGSYFDGWQVLNGNLANLVMYSTVLSAGQISTLYAAGHGQCVAPAFAPAAGSFTAATSVTITTSTNGATIRYTTDGTTPTETHGTVYSSPVPLSATTTLQAIAYETGYLDSIDSIGNFCFPCAPPSFNPAPGVYSSAQTVTISTATGSASIRYTTDGSTPSETPAPSTALR